MVLNFEHFVREMAICKISLPLCSKWLFVFPHLLNDCYNFFCDIRLQKYKEHTDILPDTFLLLDEVSWILEAFRLEDWEDCILWLEDWEDSIIWLEDWEDCIIWLEDWEDCVIWVEDCVTEFEDFEEDICLYDRDCWLVSIFSYELTRNLYKEIS